MAASDQPYQASSGQFSALTQTFPMSNSPPPPSSPEKSEALSTKHVYDQFVAALHPSQTSILEIDILPSTHPPQILSDYPALALPKSLLANFFLLARQAFFDQRPQSQRIGDSGYDARLSATSIILLFDPNHVTAANFRKRHILQCSTKQIDTSKNYAANFAEPQLLDQALSEELTFVTSLLTSPLNKHAKSSTLWAQRLWIFQHFLEVVINMYSAGRDKSHTSNNLWSRELHIVMKAGERHPRNYYAWNYARQLFCIFQSFIGRVGDCRDLLVDTAGEVHRWCLMHPRDISGWAFLVFWLDKGRDQVRWGELNRSTGGLVEVEVRRILIETREWVKKYDWKGESLEWFLKALEEIGLEEE